MKLRPGDSLTLTLRHRNSDRSMEHWAIVAYPHAVTIHLAPRVRHCLPAALAKRILRERLTTDATCAGRCDAPDCGFCDQWHAIEQLVGDGSIK